jgi:PAS domain S-box-containing protein
MSDPRTDAELVSALIAAAVQAIPHPLLISDYETVLWVNEPCRRLLAGSGTQDVTGRSVLDVVHPDMRKATAERKDVVLHRNQPMDGLPMKFVALDGSVVSDTVSLVPIEFDGRKCALGFFGTPSRPARERGVSVGGSCAASQYALIFESIPACLLLHDNARILAANAACRQILGATSREQLVGQPIESIVHPDGLESGVARRRMMSELGVDHLQRVPVKLRRAHGDELRLRVDALVLSTSDGKGILVTTSALGPETGEHPRASRRTT